MVRVAAVLRATNRSLWLASTSRTQLAGKSRRIMKPMTCPSSCGSLVFAQVARFECYRPDLTPIAIQLAIATGSAWTSSTLASPSRNGKGYTITSPALFHPVVFSPRQTEGGSLKIKDARRSELQRTRNKIFSHRSPSSYKRVQRLPADQNRDPCPRGTHRSSRTKS